MTAPAPASPRPAEICRRLLDALAASDGRRRRRKRNTTPDAIGMALKRRLIEETVREDPEPDGYEGWLLARCLADDASGPVRAMALELLSEWRLAQASGEFRSWLERGAPSDDASAPPRGTSCTSSPTHRDTDRSGPPPAPPPWPGPPDRASC